MKEELSVIFCFTVLITFSVIHYAFAQTTPTVTTITTYTAEFNGTKIQIPFPEGWTGIKMNNASLNMASPNGFDPKKILPKLGGPLDSVNLAIYPGDAYQNDALPLKGYHLTSFADYITKVPDEQKQLYLGFRGCNVINDSLEKINGYDSEKTSLQCGEAKKGLVYIFASDNKYLILVAYGGMPEAVDNHLPKIEQAASKITLDKATDPIRLITSVSALDNDNAMSLENPDSVATDFNNESEINQENSIVMPLN
jgi:hypothetical protein